MTDFIFNFMSQHKERFISVAFGIGTFAVGYLFGAPTYLSAFASFGMACFPETKKAAAALSALMPVLAQAASARIMKSPRLQIALLLSGETIGYLCGAPLPLLTMAPFIMAPTLLQTIKNYAYLAIPLGIMALQINKDPAQYLTRNLLSFAAIGGLFFGKRKMIKVMQTLDKNPKQQLGLIVAGEILGYLCGVPMPLLTVFPLIVAPKLLQPIINYSYLTMPLGIMLYQINKDPAQYLRGNLLNLIAIGGLFFGKKVISSAKTENELFADLEDDSNSEYELSDEDLNLNVPQVPLSALNNLCDEESASDEEFKPKSKDYYSSYNSRSKGPQIIALDDIPSSQPVKFVGGLKK